MTVILSAIVDKPIFKLYSSANPLEPAPVQRFLSLPMTDETGSTHAGDTTADTPSRSYRVKLYKLDAEGTWEDQGTGYCIYKTVIYPSTTLPFLGPSRSLFDLTTYWNLDRCNAQCRGTRMSLMRSLCAPSETRPRYSSQRYWISRSITANKVYSWQIACWIMECSLYDI